MMASAVNEETVEKEYSLQDVFKNIIDGKSVEVEVSNIKHIMKNNLMLETDTLQWKLQCVLPYMIIHFIKSWPGWQKSDKYFQHQISFINWYAKFKEYLIFKASFFIKNYEKTISTDDYKFKTMGVQTDPIGEKLNAPFVLEIRGPPRLLNSVVFAEGGQGDVILKEYKVNSLWSEMLSIRQMINWCSIEVEFSTSELRFKRSNEHEYKRFLTFSTEKLFFNKPDVMIEEIEIVDEKVERKAYTLNALKEYCNLYITLLRKYQMNLAFTNRYLDQIEIILEDFILDIVDINLNSMATNTSVLFNIGNSIYARNKTIKTSDEALCLTDSITPRTRLTLYEFSAITNPENASEPFPKLQKLFNNADSESIKDLIPTITYKCTFCDEGFQNNLDTWIHLRFQHNMEQPVLCFRCKQQFKITDLAGSRWRHDCSCKTIVTNEESKS